MQNELNYRVQRWQPPARPDWVARLNDEGRCLDIAGVVPLDAQSLIRTACANTGLDDFGSDDWREPFTVFTRSLEEDAELNLTGRLLTRSDLLTMLEARLRVEHAYRQHPEIDDQVLAPPMLIVGAGRSGTSALQNLMACDPDNGTPKHWEALFPAPPPEAATYRSDPRIALADARMTQWNRVVPEIASMHEFGGDMPTELIQLEALSFQAPGWLIFCGFTPGYERYLAGRSAVPGLAYAKRVMKLLQWRNPRRRWLLKSPDAMRYLVDVFRVFPDLRLIWTHRDPLKTISSVVSLVGTILWMRSDRRLDDRAIAQLTNPVGLARLFGQVMDQLDAGHLPRDRLHNVQYLDLIDDPLTTVQRLYREMGIEPTPAATAAMARHVAEHPRQARPAHRYSVGDADRLGEERGLFERYQQRFEVSVEP